MATYRNKQDDTIIRGSEFKLNISMDVIDEQHMEDVEFFCTFKAGGKGVNIQKSSMIKVDADNYLAPLDSIAGDSMMHKQYDLFNLISVDTTNKLFKCMRIGLNNNKALQEHNYFCWDYKNKKLVGLG